MCCQRPSGFLPSTCDACGIGCGNASRCTELRQQQQKRPLTFLAAPRIADNSNAYNLFKVTLQWLAICTMSDTNFSAVAETPCLLCLSSICSLLCRPGIPKSCIFTCCVAQGYLKALHGGRLSPLTATAAAAAGATQHHDTTAAARQQHSSSSSSNRRSSSASPARANRPVAATVSRPCTTPDLLISRPLSAQLQSVRAKAVQNATAMVQSSTWPPAGSTSHANRCAVCHKVK